MMNVVPLPALRGSGARVIRPAPPDWTGRGWTGSESIKQEQQDL